MEAARLGCDAIGLVFYAKSPRNVSKEQALSIVRALPPFVCAVGLFVNAGQAFVEDVLATVQLDLLQFHGDESPEACRQYGKPYAKAVPVQNSTNLLQYAVDFSDAKALLLDTYVEGVAGGTGQAFDWSLIPGTLPKPIILAGGLTAENVAQAVKQVQPYAVDVSGGVESAKGIKDAAKMAAFIRGVKDAAL